MLRRLTCHHYANRTVKAFETGPACTLPITIMMYQSPDLQSGWAPQTSAWRLDTMGASKEFCTAELEGLEFFKFSMPT